MGDSEHLILIAVQILLAMAILSFLQYSVRTAHVPDAVNRRAKVLCAFNLMLMTLGAGVVLFYPTIGVALCLTGAAGAVATMAWLESRARKIRPVRRPEAPSEEQ